MAGHRHPPINTELLKRARLRNGLTLRALAERCAALGEATDHSNISAYERGTSRPGPRKLLVLTTALGLDPDELLLLDDAA